MVKKTLTVSIVMLSLVLVFSSSASAQEVETLDTGVSYSEQPAPAATQFQGGHIVSPTYNPPDDLGRAIRWSALMSASISDAISTTRALGIKGAREANPLLAPLAGHKKTFVATKIGWAALTAYTLDNTAKHHPKRALVMAIGISALQGAIAYRNNQVYQRNVKLR